MKIIKDRTVHDYNKDLTTPKYVLDDVFENGATIMGIPFNIMYSSINDKRVTKDSMTISEEYSYQWYGGIYMKKHTPWADSVR